MVKLKRLKIEKYRNVKPGTELLFRDSLNVLLGRNGTGKTTLLNLIVQLLSWDFSQLQDEAVDLEYELLTSRAELLVWVRTELIRQPPGAIADPRKFSGDVLAMGLAQSGPRYSISIKVSISLGRKVRYLLKVEGLKLTLEGAQGNVLEEINLTRPLIGQWTLSRIIDALGGPISPSLTLAAPVDALWSATFGGLGFLRRFDESLSYLEHITREGTFLARKVQLDESMAFYSLVPMDGGPDVLLNGLMAEINSDPDLDEFRIESGEKEAEFLDRLVELLGFKSAQLRIQRSSRTSGPDERIDFGSIRFDFTRWDGSVINHTLLSYGQKRLLAFYYYLASNSDCVVADELVNGMHHEWIEACLEDIGGREAFLTSQNPLLLDYLSFESAEEVRSSFVLCRTQLHEDREQMVWENMTAEDAEGFFKAYQVAIQHVSELLRTRGLW